MYKKSRKTNSSSNRKENVAVCGIVGIYNFKDSMPVDRERLREATNLLMHRGPDGVGFHLDDAAGVGLGHRRLSIIDLSTGNQPMCNEDGTVWIVYNGELYNYLDLKATLIQRGHVFKTRSDTEVIIHTYEEYGEECTNQFNGIFAFAIWDSKKRTLFLARDHFGVKPLYYGIHEHGIMFASEMKSILQYTQMSREINVEALHLCLTFRHTPAPHTLMRGIQKLPAAHYLQIGQQAGVQLKSYWTDTIMIDHQKSEDEWIALLRTILAKAVKQQMMADVPVGISLSGGVDSGTILALMTQHAGRGVHAFTISFEGGRKVDDEAARAKATAVKFGATFHQRTISSKDYMDFMDRYLWHLEEPVGNESAAAYYFVAEMAKGTVKVILNGQGADEPFAGYDRYMGLFYFDKLFLHSNAVVKLLAALPLSLERRNQLKRLADVLGMTNDDEKIASVASILTREERKSLFGEELYAAVVDGENDHAVDEVQKILGNSADGTLVEKMLLYDMFSSLSENLLLSEDKMAMAAGIEARVPFLDREFIAAALSIPASMKIRNFNGKYIHKKVCEAYLPKDVVFQKKIGFTIPVEQWLKTTLGEQLMDYFHSTNSLSREYLQVDKIDKMFEEHKAEVTDHKRFLYLLLSLEKWNRLFLHSE